MIDATTTPAAGRILVVDDEASIVDAVATALRYEGFEVEEAASGREALSAVGRDEPDLVVLDWMLPDLEGIEVGRRLREQGFKTAILFLTAKDAVENKVEALRAGGDDYVTKPFSLAEVVARVQAILRRTNGDLPGDVLRYADLRLDEARHEVFRGEEPIALTATEFSLLRYFLLNPRARALEGADPPERVAVRLRRQLERRRDVRELSPAQARSCGAAAHQDGSPGRLHARSRRDLSMSRMSLRARLLLGVIVLAAVGLVAADVATYSSLGSFLIGRTDNSLEQAHLSVEHALGGRPPAPGDDEHDPGPGGPQAPNAVVGSVPGDYVELRRLNGSVVVSGIAGDFSESAAAPKPRLPETIDLPAPGGEGDRVRFFTVDAVSGGERYRVRASIEKQDPGLVMLLAAPLHDVDGTLHRLLLVELLVTGAVLLGIALLGLWVVRVSLRPLAAIGATAAAIAGGDLSHRVERADRTPRSAGSASR